MCSQSSLLGVHQLADFFSKKQLHFQALEEGFDSASEIL